MAANNFISIKDNNMEGKSPFLIGVAGGTASGKVKLQYLIIILVN